jgi:prepilin-type N-terminal cleavage/methylation domain-containing protein
VAVDEVAKGGAAVGARRRRARSERGFTLLELIVTLLILMIVVGLSVPVVGRSTDAVRSRAEVAGFSAVLRHARELAITRRVAHTVVIDPTNRTMTVLAGPEAEVRETRPLPDRMSVEATPQAAFTVRFEPQGMSSGGEYRVKTGDVVYRVTVDPVTGRVKNTRL